MRQAGQLGHPANDLSLHLDRRLVAAAEIGVQPAGQHLGEHADGRAAAVDPAHEPWVQVARAGRQHLLHEVLMDLGRGSGAPG